MSFLITVGVCAFSFFLGKTFARVENSQLFRDQLILLIDAIIKVDRLLAFKGQSIKDLRIEQVVQKVKEQLDLKQNE
jgi:hypothetical protein